MTMDLCSLNKNKYEIWELNEIGEVAYIKFSPCTSRIGTVLSDGKSVRILQVDYTKHDYREIFTYHSDFEIEVCVNFALVGVFENNCITKNAYLSFVFLGHKMVPR